MQRIGPYLAAPAIIRELGADPEPILASAGLAASDFASAEHRVPFASIARFSSEAARRTLPHFGLLLGRAHRLDAYGVVGELMRCSATLGEALAALADHQHAYSQAGLVFVLRRAGTVDLGYALYEGGAEGAAQVYDAALASGVTFLRELCGPGWQPTEVFLPHAEPGDARHYMHLFRVRPRFDAEYCAMRFPASHLDRPLPGADAEARRQVLARITSEEAIPFLQAVYRTLRVQLLQGPASGDSVAAALGLHRRTLNRRLQDERTTFQHCLDHVRFEVACQLLATSHVSLDDIAASLGYSGISSFMRTFRRWSGTTPGKWRRSSGVLHAEP